MPARERTVEVSRDALLAQGVPAGRLPVGRRYRILARFEEDEMTGQDAVGWYLEIHDGARWTDWPVSDDEAEAGQHVRAYEALAQRTDPGTIAWMGEWDVWLNQTQ